MIEELKQYEEEPLLMPQKVSLIGLRSGISSK